jgi:hypothetical protein
LIKSAFSVTSTDFTFIHASDKLLYSSELEKAPKSASNIELATPGKFGTVALLIFNCSNLKELLESKVPLAETKYRLETCITEASIWPILLDKLAVQAHDVNP